MHFFVVALVSVAVVTILIKVVLLIVYTIDEALFEFGYFAENFFEIASLKTVCRHDDKVNLMLTQDFEQLVAILLVVLLLFNLTRATLLLEASLASLAWRTLRLLELSRWHQVIELFGVHKLTFLVDNGDHRLEVLVVEWIKDRTHDTESLALLNELVLNQMNVLHNVRSSSVIRLWLEAISSNLEVTHLNETRILFFALVDDEGLSVLSQLFLNLINDAVYKASLVLCL